MNKAVTFGLLCVVIIALVPSGAEKCSIKKKQLTKKVCELNDQVSGLNGVLEEYVKKADVLELEDRLEKSQKENEDIKRKVEALLRSNIYVDRNLALNKTTNQSSIYTDASTTIQRPAVDGSENDQWSSGSCMQTHAELGPWWRVDLGSDVIVGKVVIINRADCCGLRLANLVITVHASGADNSTGQECGRFLGPGHDGQIVTILCHRSLVGRVVQVQIDGKGQLNFCEVMVYSRQ